MLFVLFMFKHYISKSKYLPHIKLRTYLQFFSTRIKFHN
jgi:hypothetical protein